MKEQLAASRPGARDPEIRAARLAVQLSIGAAGRDERRYGNTADGTPPSPLLVGSLMRVFLAPEDPDAHAAVRLARGDLERAQQHARVDRGEVAAAARVRAIAAPALRAEPDYPPVHEVLPGSYTWLQRAMRIVHIGTVLHAACADPAVPDNAVGTTPPHPAPPHWPNCASLRTTSKSSGPTARSARASPNGNAPKSRSGCAVTSLSRRS